MTAPQRRIYVDASMASVHLLWTYDVQVSAATIRSWGNRGLVSRRPRGDYRYDLQEVIDFARGRGLIDSQ